MKAIAESTYIAPEFSLWIQSGKNQFMLQQERCLNIILATITFESKFLGEDSLHFSPFGFVHVCEKRHILIKMF